MTTDTTTEAPSKTVTVRLLRSDAERLLADLDELRTAHLNRLASYTLYAADAKGCGDDDLGKADEYTARATECAREARRVQEARAAIARALA